MAGRSRALGLLDDGGMVGRSDGIEWTMNNFDPVRLVQIRKSRGLTQRALAQAAGISQALVAELERGKHPPSSASLSKLASALSVPETEFHGK